jgi:hypothetical protein
LGVPEFLTDLLKTGIPGLAAAALMFFKPITGIGLAHESWEIQIQKAASFFGVLITLYIVLRYARVPKDQKLGLLKNSLYLTAFLLLVDMVARVVALDLAWHDPWIHLARDRLWPTAFFLLLVSLLRVAGFLGQLLRKEGN